MRVKRVIMQGYSGRKKAPFTCLSFSFALAPTPFRKQTKMNQGLKLVEGTWSRQEGAEIQSRRPGCDRGGWGLSPTVHFLPPIDALPLCPGQGAEGQGNQWSDILGSLFAPRAGRLCSRPTFPGLAVWPPLSGEVA